MAIQHFYGKPFQSIHKLKLDPTTRQELKRKMGLDFDSTSRTLHVLGNKIHEYSMEEQYDSLEDFYSHVEWSRYNKGNEMHYFGKTAGNSFGLELTEEVRKSLKDNLDIDCKENTKTLHISMNTIQEYNYNIDALASGLGTKNLEYFYGLIDWDRYKKSRPKTAPIAIHHKSLNDYDKHTVVHVITKDQFDDINALLPDGERGLWTDYKENTVLYLKERTIGSILGDTKKYGYPTIQFDEAYKLLAAVKNTGLFLLDVSLIKTTDDARIKTLKRAFPHINMSALMSKPFMEVNKNGAVTFPEKSSKTEWLKTNPNGEAFESATHNTFLKRLGVFTPDAFIVGKEYVIRTWDSMELEHGLSATGNTIGNKNTYNKDTAKLANRTFVANNKDHFEMGTEEVFPDECYETDNSQTKNSIRGINKFGLAPSYTIIDDLETRVDMAKTNIFSGETVAKAPKIPKMNIQQVGERHFHDNCEINIDELVHDYEIEKMEVNENRYIAAMEMGLEYDNLEEKSKRIQDIITNELDSPEAVADKEWVYLWGGSGSGKTTEAVKYCKNKGINFIKQAGFGQLTGDDLLGYKSITDGTYFRSLLRDAVEHGMVFIFDEMDACNPNTLLILNELKGEEMQFPDKKIIIHKDFRLIATGNTIGFSEDFNGRTKRDRATAARFSDIEYNLTELDLGERYGGSYITKIKDLDDKEPREIQREVRQMKQKEKSNATKNIYK